MSAPELGTAEVSELSACLAHLMTIDDVLAEANEVGTYLALCGAFVPEWRLPSSLCPEGCECDLSLYCPECVREVVRARAGQLRDD